MTTKTFEIDEYVLPKFEVTITAPTDATFSDGTFTVTIKAVYTYGKNVKGVAEVTATEAWSQSVSRKVKKQVDINGIANVEFKISDLKTDLSYYGDYFDVTASITEALTGSIVHFHFETL